MNPRGSSEHYRLVEDVFQRAADLPRERRAGFLARCCGDAALREQVEALLRGYEAAGDRFDRPLYERGAAPSDAPDPVRIGRYDVVRCLGQGGMAVVYEATQEQPRRSVAIKVIRPGGFSAGSRRRFEVEAAALARLQHPGIAHIYEAGIAEVVYAAGAPVRQPFFAMELVRGESLSSYVHGEGLGTEERLELFAGICAAIEHAHQKGVIHRDLKPANILVTPGGQPRVLDFGVARVTECDLQTTIGGAGARLVGTLPYMSPEQIDGKFDQLDTRSDVYALGVILYELLTGRLPYEVSQHPIAAAARIIAETAPAPLSAVDRAYRGDLDVIAAKALEKDPARRYQSAGELGREVRRHLRGEAIEARRDSGWYVLRKQLGRHRTAVAAVAAFFALITASSVAMSVLYRGQARERHRAETALIDAEESARHAEAARTFLAEMLLSADPQHRHGRDLTLREVLDDAGARLNGGLLSSSPKVEANVRETVAQTYFNLGLYLSAIPHYEWLHDHYRRQDGFESPRAIRALLAMGRAQTHAYRLKEARRTLETCLAHAVALKPPDDELVLAAMDGLGYALLGLGLFDDARPLHEEALERIEDTADESHPLLPDVLTNLAYASTRKGDLLEAEQLLTRALRAVEKEPAARSALANRIRINLAKEVYNRTGREDEAVRLLHATLERSRQLLGQDHTETNSVLIWLSRVLRSQGRASEAVELLREAAAGYEQVRGIERSDPLHVIGELAELLESLGQYDDAIRTLENGLARAIGAHGEEHAETARWIYKLANIVTASGDYERATEAAKRALRIRESIYGTDHEIVAESLQQLGWTLACAGKFDQSLAPYRRALDVNRKRLGPAHRETARSAVTLSFALFFGGQADAGVDLLRRTYESLREEVGETHATAIYAARFLSRLLGYHGCYDEALELCERLEAATSAMYGTSDTRVALWQVQRGWHLYNSGNAPAAVQALQSALSSYEALYVGREAPSDATLFTMHRLSEALTLLGDTPQAERLARTAWSGLRDKYGDAHRRGALAKCALGRAILAQGRPEEAEAILRECVATLASLPGPLAYRAAEDAYAAHMHARALIAIGRIDDGERLLWESRESIGRFRTRPLIVAPAGAKPSDTSDALDRLMVFP